MRFDCLAVSLEAGLDNCDARAVLDRVTDLASLANFERPPFVSSSIGCLRAVMSRNVQRNSTTILRSFFTGDICKRSHSGVPESKCIVTQGGSRCGGNCPRNFLGFALMHYLLNSKILIYCLPPQCQFSDYPLV